MLLSASLLSIERLSNVSVYSLEMLDKMEPPAVLDGYGISIAYACLLDIVRSISLAIEGPSTVNLTLFCLLPLSATVVLTRA